MSMYVQCTYQYIVLFFNKYATTQDLVTVQFLQ